MSVFVDLEKQLGSFLLKVKFEAGEETLALLGASGCGKSMTLKCIAGVEKPDKGRIVADGVTLFDSEKGINLSPPKRQLGLMFQSYALFPNMTVRQNILAGAKRLSGKRGKAEEAEKMLERFGLNKHGEHYPHQLSGGQQQRTALARMLISSPRALLLDEPFSALDSHLRFRMEQEVREVIRSFGKTVILVSHNRDEVFRMADKIAVMEMGRIESLGRKKDIFADPGTIAAARLTGCKNISPVAKLDDHHVLALDWGIELETAGVIGKASAVGIRMHDIRAGRGENTLFCTVEEEIENPFSYTIMLKVREKPEALPFGWELDKKEWQKIRAKSVEIHIPAKAVLLLAQGAETG